MGAIRLATTNSTDEEYGGYVPEMEWTLIESNNSTTAKTVDITPYKEVRLVMVLDSNNLIVGSTIATPAECIGKGLNVYFNFANLSGFVRLANDGTKLYSGTTGYTAYLYGR